MRIAGIACLSGCKRPCAAAVIAPGKVGYVFGDVPPTAAGATDLLTVALAHQSKTDGFLPRAERPEQLRGGILTRLPPVEWVWRGTADDITWPS